MKIKNFEDLAVDLGRSAVLSIVESGLEAIDTETVVSSQVSISGDDFVVGSEKYSLAGIKRIFLIGIGKCSLEASAEIEKILGNRLSDGIVIDVKDGGEILKKAEYFKGTHPFPSQVNVDTTNKIIGMLSGLSESDLVIFVVSGGGSVLLCQPNNFTFEEEMKITKSLMKHGATIQELNTVRKHISSARGGFLAKYAYPARVISLIFSDVPGNDISFISSGPTVKDNTTISDAVDILNRYDLKNEFESFVKNMIETPKEEKYFEKVSNILVLSNETALKAMKKKSEELGFKAEIRSSNISGEAKIIGRRIVHEISKAPAKTVYLYAGETTVIIKGHGRGGRNQELALSAIAEVEKGQYLVSMASDGVDNSENAGAICDNIGMKKAKNLGLKSEDFLEDNDSLNFFEKIGCSLKTGDTGSNVSDLMIALKI